MVRRLSDCQAVKPDFEPCLSAFLIGLLVLGGFWIWLNVRFL